MFNRLSLDKNFYPALAIVLVAALLMWSLGLPLWIKHARGALVTSFKDTLDDSDVSVGAKHTISYTSATAVTAAQTIKLGFADAWTIPAFVVGDMTFTGATLVASCGAGTDEVTMTASNTGGDKNVTFTVCAGDTVTAGAKTITLGTGATKITNPATTGSQLITLAGTQTDSGSTRVFIIDDITVTATVDTTFTFTITGVASGATGANGEGTVTDVTTTSTTIPWGVIATGSGGAKNANHNLAVTTNATGGFTVTVWQDQNLLSANGADIDIFKDGTNAAPAAWTSPLGTLGTENTYGHEGITSEDATLSGGDTFGVTLYDAIGTKAAPLEVFFHTASADGTTANQGATVIGYKIEINALQEAATDYTQTLTYIATPTF